MSIFIKDGFRHKKGAPMGTPVLFFLLKKNLRVLPVDFHQAL